MTASSAVTPRVYVACLASYNNGVLYGRWIDAAQDTDDLWAEINAMLKGSKQPYAEEWAIHDFEGFSPWSLSEYESIEHVSKAALLIEEHGEAAAAWISNDSSVLDSDDLDESFRESYAGCWSSEREYAENLIEDIGLPGIGPVRVNVGPDWQPREVDLLDELGPYLDWDALTTWALDGDTWTHTDGEHNVHVFRSV